MRALSRRRPLRHRRGMLDDSVQARFEAHMTRLRQQAREIDIRYRLERQNDVLRRVIK